MKSSLEVRVEEGSVYDCLLLQVIDVKSSIDVKVEESSVGAYYCRVSVTGKDSCKNILNILFSLNTVQYSASSTALHFFLNLFLNLRP